VAQAGVRDGLTNAGALPRNRTFGVSNPLSNFGPLIANLDRVQGPCALLDRFNLVEESERALHAPCATMARMGPAARGYRPDKRSSVAHVGDPSLGNPYFFRKMNYARVASVVFISQKASGVAMARNGNQGNMT